MIPVQNSPPDNNTCSQRYQAILTPTVHQLSANLNRVPPMEGEEPSKRGSMNPIISISLSGLLGGYPGISQGTGSRLGEAKDEEEESEETDVAAFLADAPESPDTTKIARSNQPTVSKA
ncbi:hypothetical protein O181_005502 [Austropuccinia psidii MF-1]|uniref:Uncharacterized protein n=1 Tax=Austropuccinia psidii MF-1 TaxID=1389203 RepID=A0A9Q3BI82_9BASI|nr:hypothetical protein [Austropuccinia psidii MF-1]